MCRFQSLTVKVRNGFVLKRNIDISAYASTPVFHVTFFRRERRHVASDVVRCIVTAIKQCACNNNYVICTVSVVVCTRTHGNVHGPSKAVKCLNKCIIIIILVIKKPSWLDKTVTSVDFDVTHCGGGSTTDHDGDVKRGVRRLPGPCNILNNREPFWICFPSAPHRSSYRGPCLQYFYGSEKKKCKRNSYRYTHILQYIVNAPARVGREVYARTYYYLCAA